MEYIFEDELYHHGIKGMHWGVRRYQNADGSYTPAGRARYGYAKNPNMKMNVNEKGDSSVTRKVKADYNNLSEKDFRAKYKTTRKTYAKRVDKYGDPYMNSPLARTGKKLAGENNTERKELTDKDKQKKAIKIGAAVVGTATVAVGAAYVAKKMNMKAVNGLKSEHFKKGFDYVLKSQKMRLTQDLNGVPKKLAQNYDNLAGFHFEKHANGNFTTKEKIDYLKRTVNKPKIKTKPVKLDNRGLDFLNNRHISPAHRGGIRVDTNWYRVKKRR